MTIRNKRTGETKEINPTQASQYGIAAPQGGGSLTDLIPGGTGLLGGLVGSALGPVGTVAGAGVGAASGDALRQLLLGLTGQGPQLGQQDVGNAANVGLNAASMAMLPATLQAGAGFNPKQILGKKIEEKVSKAGNVPNELLEKFFGSIRQPNPELYSKLTAGGEDETILIQKLRNLIGTMGQSDTLAMNPTFLDILNKRVGAYQQGYEPTATKSLQGLYKNIGRAYSNVLHEGVPGLQGLDKAYGTLSKLSGIPETAVKYAPRAVAYYMLYRLLGGLTNKIMPQQ